MRDEIKNEIIELSATIAAIGNSSQYKVPADYFNDFPDEVMSRIQLPRTEIPFTQPAPFYFESLTASILDKVKAADNIAAESEAARELRGLSPLLAGIGKANVYQVPKTFFSTFKVSTAAMQETAQPVLLHKPVKWLRYAVAAAVAGITVTGGVLLFNNAGSRTSARNFAFTKNYNTPLSKLSNDAIADYLQVEPEDIDAMPPLYDDNKESAASLTEDLLQNVSDNDIRQYLKDNDEIGENDIKGI